MRAGRGAPAHWKQADACEFSSRHGLRPRPPPVGPRAARRRARRSPTRPRTARSSRRSARAIRPSSASRRFWRRCISRSSSRATSRGNAMRHVAEAIGCTPAEVEDVVSFYTMFYTRPVGTSRDSGVPHAVVRADGRRARDRGAVAARSASSRARPTRRASSRCSKSSASAPATARRSSASTTTGTSARQPEDVARAVDGLRDARARRADRVPSARES